MTRPRSGFLPLLLGLAFVPLAGCNVENTSDPDGEVVGHVDKLFTGYVIDENGHGLADVEVVSDDGSLTATTNALGQFVLPMPIYDGRSALGLAFSKEGYLRSNQIVPIYDETSSYTTLVTLQAMTEVQTLDNATGGRLLFADAELRLTFGEGAFADEAGNVVEGEVQVAARMIRPETLRSDRLPVPSMQARDPGTPDREALIASYGMFTLEATAEGGVPVYPAAGSTFRAEITGIERFIEQGIIFAYDANGEVLGKESIAIPLWTMTNDDTVWDFAGWFTVEATSELSAEEKARHGWTSLDAQAKVADDGGTPGSDNTLYSVVTDIPVGGATGNPPPNVQRYNCDARPRLTCVTGKIEAEGLYGETESQVHGQGLSTMPVAGAWVGFDGVGLADNCTQCECTTTRVVEVCETKVDGNGDEYEECRNETETTTTNPRPENSGFGDVCSQAGADACTCTEWTELQVLYQGGAYTDSSGKFCANVGSGGRISKATVLKDWLITETDPKTGVKTSYPVAYEHNERPNIPGLRTGTMCEDGTGACGVWNHTMPCEWFWANNACAVVGGCEVHHLRDYDEEDNISYYE